MKNAPNDGQPDHQHFSVLGYLIINKRNYRFSSINHYNSFFKHKDAMKEKSEIYNYSEFGDNSKLEDIGFDCYCKDIWKIARDPKTIYNMHFKIKERNSYIGENIEEGDIIKIGRIKFKLRKYNLYYNPPNRRRQRNSLPEILTQQIEKENFVRKQLRKSKNINREEVVKENEEIPPCRF